MLPFKLASLEKAALGQQKDQTDQTTQQSKIPAKLPRVRQWAGLCVDGLPFIFMGVSLTVAVYYFFGPITAVPLSILTGLVVWFFRDPERQIPQDERVLLSPADGKVIDIRRVRYPRLLEGEATKVSIFMSVLNVHVNRIPFGGIIRQVQRNPGKFFVAHAEKASLDNEQVAVVLDTYRGAPLMFVQIAGMLARRIVCRLKVGERVDRGERFGLIRFGSRCDIYLPDAVEAQVKLGENVTGGETVIGKFK